MKIAVAAAAGSTVRERRRFEMRCQCGFNSFDHHLVCPKCRKDLAATRRLLNLDGPAPGKVNFFQIAKMPRTFLGAAVGGEDFEDLQPLEDIRPINYGANQSPPMERAIPAQAWSSFAASGAAGITPAPFQAFNGPADEPAPEIEMTDDFEVDRSGSRPHAGLAPANPVPPHRAFMDQIKTVLTETGDLPETGPSVPGAGIPASNQAGALSEDDDLASLLADLDLDELERDL